MTKSPQQRYLEKPVETVVCDCGCGGKVVRRKLHYFPSYLKKTGGRLPRYVNGHNPISQKTMAKLIAANRGRTGIDSAHWKGGRVVWQGYIYIRIGSDYVAEHRLVVEKMLNRPLMRGEIVHHKDGNRSNNLPNNLELMDCASHARQHAKPRDKVGRWMKAKVC